MYRARALLVSSGTLYIDINLIVYNVMCWLQDHEAVFASSQNLFKG